MATVMIFAVSAALINDEEKHLANFTLSVAKRFPSNEACSIPSFVNGLLAGCPITSGSTLFPSDCPCLTRKIFIFFIRYFLNSADRSMRHTYQCKTENTCSFLHRE